VQEIYRKARGIRLAIFDVDGVLTDGALYFSDSGEEIKVFTVRDGHGMKMLQGSGVRLAIITSRKSRSVETRARGLGIDLLYQGVTDKVRALQELLGRTEVDPTVAAYMGDDVIDLPAMKRCGLAVTVPEAPAAVKSHAHYVTRARGGYGAVREVCELIMYAQGTLSAWMSPDVKSPCISDL